MSKAENLILQLTSRALFNAPVDFNPAAVDWTSIYKEASSQALTILIWDTLSDEERAAVPENIAAIWEQDAMMHVLRNEQLLYEQKEVVHMLSEAGIPCAILKGSSSAACYPDPALRIMGDIDIFVKPEQQKVAVDILQANGFGEARGENHTCHIVVDRDGITVEVHNQLNGLDINDDKELRKCFDTFFSDALENVENVDGLPFLSDEYQAFVLIFHKLEHFLHNENLDCANFVIGQCLWTRN